MSVEKVRFCNLCAVAVGGAEANWKKHLSSKNHQKQVTAICDSCKSNRKHFEREEQEVEVEPIQCAFDGVFLFEDWAWNSLRADSFYHCRFCHLSFDDLGRIVVWQNRIHDSDDFVDTTDGESDVEIPEKYRNSGFLKRAELSE